MYLMPGFVDMHVHAGGAPKNADAEYAYKLWLAHGVTTVRGVPLGGNASPSARSRAARRTRSSRRASSTTSARAAAGTRVRSTTPESRPRVGALGGGERHRRPEARRRTPGHHGGAARRSEEERPRLDRAPAAGRRRADERDQGGAARPRHRHALLRPLRIAAQGLRRPAVAGRHERRRRAVALRPGRAAVEQDPRAGQPGVEGVPRRAPQARHGLRSDADDLLRRPRRDAVPRRRVARQVHAAVADGLLRAEPREPRRRTGTTGPPKTKSRGATSTRCGSSW